jgi:hypothetical protein
VADELDEDFLGMLGDDIHGVFSALGADLRKTMRRERLVRPEESFSG